MTVTSTQLANIARKFPDFILVSAINIRLPYNNGTYKRRLMSAGIVDLFPDQKITDNETTNAKEITFCFDEHNGAYDDVYPRIQALENSMHEFLELADKNGSVKDEEIELANSLLTAHLPHEIECAFSPLCEEPLVKHADFLSICELELSASVDVSPMDSYDSLRVYGYSAASYSVDEEAKTITLEHETTTDSGECFSRLVALETQFRKLIDSAKKSAKNKPNATQTKTARKLLENKERLF
ncbi:hypothetical protein [Vibrio sp. D431a]|uniref:hypothetical protein n=1 Tax=Vibrio sp. D431a TaxID=2837388 RepID=UPI002552ED7F|nr:hypothetical protein [Vibrio sp. D431a]MDK9793692.1 hypothetical protein [Vibrio sp. D431a]